MIYCNLGLLPKGLDSSRQVAVYKFKKNDNSFDFQRHGRQLFCLHFWITANFVNIQVAIFCSVLSNDGTESKIILSLYFNKFNYLFVPHFYLIRYPGQRLNINIMLINVDNVYWSALGQKEKYPALRTIAIRNSTLHYDKTYEVYISGKLERYNNFMLN